MQSIKSILSFFLISCENFNELTKNKLVLQRIWLTPYFNHLVLLDDKTKKLIFFMLWSKESPCTIHNGNIQILLESRSHWRKKIDWRSCCIWRFHCNVYSWSHSMLPMFIIQNFQKVTYAFGIWFTKQNDSMNICCNEIATCNSFLNRP